MNDKEIAVQLYHWTHDDRADNFTALLFTMITKADPGNRFRLQQGFPDEVRIWKEWQESNERAFWEKYGLK